MAYFLIFVSNYYILYDYIQVRIALACSIFIYQLYYLSIGKKRNAFIVWILATCCHFFLLLGIVAFFISKKTISTTEGFLYFLLFLLAFILAALNFSVVYIAEYIPVNYFINDRNDGISIPSIRVSNTIKKALNISKGDYCVIISGDDIFLDKDFITKAKIIFDNDNKKNIHLLFQLSSITFGIMEKQN